MSSEGLGVAMGDPGGAIRATELSKSYGRAAGAIHALRGVTIDVARGERLGLLGRSGSGKSTLLNLLGGLDRPTSGQLSVAGLDLVRMSRRALARYRSARVGMIFQSFNLVPSLSALRNVELPLIFAGRAPAERREAAAEVLHAVGLGDRLDYRPARLSGGEAQRVAVARALVAGPEILLADEPTGNLDSVTAREVMALILDHVARRGATLVLVTHDEELARGCTDRILRLADGRVRRDEAPAGPPS